MANQVGSKERRKPIEIGTTVKPWGGVMAVGTFGTAERCYWLVDKHGSVSIIPADVVEAKYDSN